MPLAEGLTMIRDLIQKLIDSTGLQVRSDVIQVSETPPLLPTRLRAAETSAAALCAQAALICEIWRRRTGRQQTAALDTEGSALALQSVFYQRQWKYPIMLTEPSYPTVDLYPTRDHRWIMINGGYPNLRDGLLDLLNSPDSAKGVRTAVGRWAAADLENAAAERGLCAVEVRTPEEWAAHPQGKALAVAPVVEITKIADGPAVPFSPVSSFYPPTGLRPLSGLRVLDLTHVIAGPTCAKT
ncbi:MAG: CoA transferase, partial [Acetobacteraceae bacterium]|nr:CoA transferase [Acetobacteraceae bacterium]